MIWVECEAKYFLRGDWTTQISLIWFVKLDFSRTWLKAKRRGAGGVECHREFITAFKL